MKRKDPADSGIEGRQAKRHAGAEEASDNCSNDSTAIQNTGGSSPRSAQTYFRAGLLDRKEQDRVRERYASSKPYKHAVISDVLDPQLLRAVRTEIQTHLSFQPKETDIYRIHQSGDLANLDGLDDAALSKLPALKQLRDALYSAPFRHWIGGVCTSTTTATTTGAEAPAILLSGRKTDMAVNVYTAGCHLLCHDDAISSRRLSYILYLTDPDRPWQARWGGALRLYPTEPVMVDGKEVKVPLPDHAVSIPPAFNQLAFFEVKAGESFHDVEEVFACSGQQLVNGSSRQVALDDGHGQGAGALQRGRHRSQDNDADENGPVRVAISGWFHVPQEGEEGYDAELAKSTPGRSKSSTLAQLEDSGGNGLDRPQPVWIDYDDEMNDGEGGGAFEDSVELTEDNLQLLSSFISPAYLTPDTVAELAEIFLQDSCLQLSHFLSPSFAAKLKHHLDKIEASKDDPIGDAHTEVDTSTDITANADAGDNNGNGTGTGNDKTTTPALVSPGQDLSMKVATPPHRHHFLYRQAQPNLSVLRSSIYTPYDDLIDRLLPSNAFRKWLALATGLDPYKSHILGRRFRRGQDYTLATAYQDTQPQLEVCLSITPKGDDDGWKMASSADDSHGLTTLADQGENGKSSKNTKKNSGTYINNDNRQLASGTRADEADNDSAKMGGYEVYMAPPSLPANSGKENSGKENSGKEKKQEQSEGDGRNQARSEAGDEDEDEAAIYRSSTSSNKLGGTDDTDDTVLFSAGPAWNCMNIILRDQGVLRFTKYVSKAAPGDRWDILAVWRTQENDDDDEDDEDEDEDVDEDGDGDDGGDNCGDDSEDDGNSDHGSSYDRQ